MQTENRTIMLEIKSKERKKSVLINGHLGYIRGNLKTQDIQGNFPEGLQAEKSIFLDLSKRKRAFIPKLK